MASQISLFGGAPAQTLAAPIIVLLTPEETAKFNRSKAKRLKTTPVLG